MGYPGGHSAWPVWLVVIALVVLIVGAVLIVGGQAKP